MSESGPIQGQGSSHFLEMPSDIFEAKGEVNSGVPLEGGIEPLDPTKWSQDPYNSLALLESASAAASRPLSNGARAPTRIPR
jgi:hypothetical protein